MTRFIASLLILTACAGPVAAAETAEAPKTRPYTLDTCIVTGEKLGSMGDTVVVVREGREIRFCCKGCIKDFDKDAVRFMKKIDEAEKARAEARTDAKTGKPAETVQPVKRGCCP